MVRIRIGVIASLVLVALAAPLAAQQIRGVIKGVVKDRDGGVLPGATVTVNSPSQIQKDLSTTTNERGEFRFPLLDAGVYEVKVTMQGFTASTFTGVRLLVGQTVELPVALELATVKAEVEVSASPVVDTERTKIGTNFTKELLSNIPNARNLNAVINFTPGATDGTVHGSSVRGNALQLDGVNVTDPVVGTQAISFNFDNLEEVAVETGGHSAEYGQVAGAVVNAVTKSGGNRFSGEGNVYYGGESLTSTNGQHITERFPNLTPNQLEKRIDTQGQLGGPIAKDKIWFFGSYRYVDADTNVVGFPELSNRNENYGYGKLTWQISPKNKLVGSYNYDSLDLNNRGATSSVCVDCARTQDGHTNTPNFEFTSVLSPTTAFQVRAAFVRSEFNLRPKNDLPGQYTLEVSPQQILVSDGREDLNKRDRNQVVASLSHYADDLQGTHDFKFGFEYEDSKAFRDFTASQGLLYYDTGTGTAGNPFVPAYVYTIQDPASREAINRWSAYVQDSWTIANRVTINPGLRIDHNGSSFPEQVAADGSTIAEVKDVASYLNYSPRIGVSFDVTGSGKSVARFAYSRLIDANVVQYFNSINPNAISGQFRVVCGGPADNGFCNPGERFSSVLLGEFGASNTTIDDNFGSPIIDEYLVGFEHEVNAEWSFGASYIDKSENNLPEDVEVGIDFFPVAQTIPGDTLVDDEGNVVDVIEGGRPVNIYDWDPRTNSSQLLITNPEPARREYRALEMTLNKRMANKWAIQSSFVLSHSAGLVGTDFGGSTSISALFNNPNSLINGFGNLNYSRPYVFKLIGAYQGPWGINLSGFYRYLAGAPFTRTVRFATGLRAGAVVINGERRGAYRLEGQNELDFRLEKEFKLGLGRVNAIVDIFNLFNIDTTTAARGRSAGTGRFGDPTEFHTPREVRLAARYIW